jgi:hypothetical protein
VVCSVRPPVRPRCRVCEQRIFSVSAFHNCWPPASAAKFIGCTHSLSVSVMAQTYRHTDKYWRQTNTQTNSEMAFVFYYSIYLALLLLKKDHYNCLCKKDCIHKYILYIYVWNPMYMFSSMFVSGDFVALKCSWNSNKSLDIPLVL